jgi:hypothetical protein
VVIAGEPAPIFYASNGQLNAAIPFDVTANTSQQVLVTRDTTISVPISVDLAPAQPAVFLAPVANAPNQGSIFAVRTTSSGQTSFLAAPSSPATAGDTLVIYSDGLGAVNQTIAPGAAAKTNDQPQVTIGGQTSTVAFSGLTPGLVGVLPNQRCGTAGRDGGRSGAGGNQYLRTGKSGGDYRGEVGLRLGSLTVPTVWILSGAVPLDRSRRPRRLAGF